MTDAQKRYYITTPIYYVNGSPHIGTATTTLLADATKRYHRLRGNNPYFLTGTDENARKVTDAAEKDGKDPKTFVDEVSQRFVRTWKYLDCDYDVFFRTTEQRHFRAVQEVFERLRASGDVYKGSYEGWYSVSDETFFRDTDVDPVTQTAKETGARVERVQEESYFFRLSAYGDRLKQHIQDNPEFLIPDTRRNEVLAFIDQGLRDLAITQNRSGWGIPVPGEEGHKVIYVWFDALINYLTESGWPDPGWENLWPADVHLMAKEIFTRFHATLWPAMLMALELPLPKHVVGHGWWTIAGEKISKSKANAAAAEPGAKASKKSTMTIPGVEEVVSQLRELSGAPEEICIDALRFYLIRDIRFTDDSEFSLEMLVTRFNDQLANDLGNVLNRVLSARYHDGSIPTPTAYDEGLKEAAERAVTGYEAALARFDWGMALQSAWTLVDALNKYLDAKAPWVLARNGDTQGVADAIYNALEGTRLAALLVSPAMPRAAQEMARQLGIEGLGQEGGWAIESRFGGLVPGAPTGEPRPIFPRIDTKKLAALLQQQKDAAKKEKSKVTTEPTPAAPAASEEAAASAPITIDDFLKVQLRVAEIVRADRVEGATKLLKLDLNLGEGEEPRTILSGIAEFYTPEELVGKHIVVVANLAPRKMRGVMSQGMLLAATDAEGRAILVTPERPVGPGAEVR